MSVTLATLRTRARERADQANSTLVSDSRLNDWINEANQRLHSMVVDALGQQYISSTSTFTTVADQSDYTLPAGFYKLYGVDLNYNGVTRTLLPYETLERNVYRESRLTGAPFVPRYALIGTSLRLYPIPTAGLTGTILYAPEATVLSGDSDAVTYPNGWERFIVIDAAIQMVIKEESNPNDLRAERERIEQEIERTKEARDLAAPKRVVDTSMADLEVWW